MKRNREIWNGLIAVEGIDGAGTTTLSRILAETLEKSGHRCLLGCEPTPGPVGRLIRDALAGRTPLTPRAMALLFSADRQEHIFGAGGIGEHRDKGFICITDRYFFSSLAYQSLESDWEWVDSINSGYPLPGHLLFLGIPVDEAQSRLSGRGSRDIYDAREIQSRVADAYARSLDAYRDSGMKILELDSRRTPEELLRSSVEFISELL